MVAETKDWYFKGHFNGHTHTGVNFNVASWNNPRTKKLELEFAWKYCLVDYYLLVLTRIEYELLLTHWTDCY